MGSSRRASGIRLLAAVLACAVLAGTNSLTRAQQPLSLFTEVADAGLAQPSESKAVRGQLRARAVGVNFAALPATASADRPARLGVSLFDGASVSVAIDQVQAQGGGLAYLGHVEGFFNSPDGQDTNSVSLVVADGVMIGSIVTPDASYQIGYDGAQQVIRQIDQAAFNDDHDFTSTADLPAVADAGAPSDGAASDDGSRVDVMVLYTATARAAAGGTTAIRNLITLGVTETNQMYANSGIGTRMRLVHMSEVAYTESGDAETDRNRLFNGSDGHLDAVHSWRNGYGADMVQMLVNNAGSGCGIAFLNGPAGSMAGQSAYAYAVTDWQCVSPNYTFAHEFGHIQGSNHAPDDPTGTGAYSYSFGFKRCTSPLFRSVMAYACPSVSVARSQNFSNPNVSVGGGATGTATQNNALSMHNTRGIIANFRQQQPLVRILSLWPPADEADRRVGQTTRLWAYVDNIGPYALGSNDYLWFYVAGPGGATAWVGPISLNGMASGAGGWYGFDWTIPVNATPGTWNYYAATYNYAVPEYTSYWGGPQAFTILGVDAAIYGNWPVSGARGGLTSRLWSYVANTGTGTLPDTTYVYFWVNGPAGPNTYVGAATLGGLAPGGGAWYYYDWAIPPGAAAGNYAYYSIVWYYTSAGWTALTSAYGPQNFTVAATPAYGGEVLQTWPVYRAGTANAPQRGFPARLWGFGHNTGLNTHDALVHMWFYVSGPGFSGYVGSDATTGVPSNGTVWRYYDWPVPAGATLGSYTYWASFWRWTGSTWVMLGGWSDGRAFGVASDERPLVASDERPAALPENIPAPPAPRR